MSEVPRDSRSVPSRRRSSDASADTVPVPFHAIPWEPPDPALLVPLSPPWRAWPDHPPGDPVWRMGEGARWLDFWKRRALALSSEDRRALLLNWCPVPGAWLQVAARVYAHPLPDEETVADAAALLRERSRVRRGGAVIELSILLTGTPGAEEQAEDASAAPAALAEPAAPEPQAPKAD